MYLRVKLPDVAAGTANFRWLDWIGHILIKNVEIEIGGQRIDKHYGEWLHIWNELTQTAGHQLGYAHMVGNIPSLTNTKQGTIASEVLYIPLQFWFNRNPGLALPLIALQYHEVKVNIEFRNKEDCYWSDATVTVNDFEASLFVDYIYLDTDERRRFAQVSHEYLIEQLQFTGDESTSNLNTKVKLNFNHPCKELIWVVQPEKFTSPSSTDNTTYKGKQWFNFSDKFFGPANLANNATPLEMGGVASGGTALVTQNAYLYESDNDIGRNPVAYAKLQLNGHDRFSEREGKYFNLVQPYQCHENVPSTGINVYSFALKPEEHQPSGTCNMSRIDTATLNLTLTSDALTGSNGSGSGAAKIKVFAVNYNVLRIMSGMGGLAYSN